MIYLISKQKELFKTSEYIETSTDECIQFLKTLQYIQMDTETEGLDCFTKALLTLQLGNKVNQYVIDWTTLSESEYLKVKEFIEHTSIPFILHNAAFDLTFLYKHNIWPKHIIDTMIIEQLIYLGYPKSINPSLIYELGLNLPQYDATGTLSYSLKHVAERRLGIDIDKTVRGKIVKEGLTPEVIVYAATDVMYLEDILESQRVDLKRESLEKAASFECEFVKCLAYFKYCGIHLDADKWKAKMDKDSAKLHESEKALNTWVLNWSKTNITVRNGKQFVITNIDPSLEVADKIKERLLKLGFFGITDTSYAKEINIQFTKVDLQGDLFSGFNTEPQCTINWASSQQVIKFFELLGIGVNTFDKKTKAEKKSIDSKQLSPQKAYFEIIPLFLKYQEAAKVVSTYGQNWLDARNPVTGRIHPEYHQLGTDTARLSSGGGVYKINAQNLPHDAETRACFTAELGNSWVSIDYQSQESRLIASVANDKAMIREFKEGCGDIHSLVAYMSYPNDIPRDTKIEDINKKYHNLRQEAKGIEFSVNYGGDAHTIANNKGIPLVEAEKIYNDFMSGFPDLAAYQKYCRKVVMDKLYILMNPVLGHRAHIYDAEWLANFKKEMAEPDFWNQYQSDKKYNPQSSLIKDFRRYMKRKSELEKQSINYRIQNRGSMCFKYSAILYFKWIVENNYQNIVKMCVPCHDEFNNEVPTELAEQEGNKIQECMVEGAKPFCPNVFLGADLCISDHWIH